MANHDDILVQFMAMIGDDVLPETAAELLAMHGWNLEAAFGSIFDEPSRMQRTSATVDLRDGSKPFIPQQRTGSIINLDAPNYFDEDLSNVDDSSSESRSFATQRSLQDEEYRDSLRIDQARQNAEGLAMERRSRMLQEPPLDDPDRVPLMIRLPNGKRVRRAFKRVDSVSVIFDFIEDSSSLVRGGYRLLATHPRQVYADGSANLADAGIQSHSSLVIEKLS